MQQEHNNLSEHNSLREKLKFDVNQAARELEMTGAFYSTYPSLFLFGITAELQLKVALFSPPPPSNGTCQSVISCFSSIYGF